MIKGHSIATRVAIVALVTIVTGLVFILNESIPMREDKFESEADLLVLFVAESSQQGASRGENLLQQDGVVLLKDSPVGTLGQTADFARIGTPDRRSQAKPIGRSIVIQQWPAQAFCSLRSCCLGVGVMLQCSWLSSFAS